MYRNFEYYAPTRVVFGVGAELETAQLIRRAGGTRVLIVYGGGSAVRSSLIGRIERTLTEQKLTFARLGGVVPNPHLDKVYAGIALGKQLRADFILAVGGGTIPSSVPEILKIMGQDVCLAAGGGVHGHPDGSRAGAKAMRQAIDATINGIGLRQYAETHPELAAALRAWGCGPEELKKNYDLMN